jgi:hypothetical protein
MNLFRSGRHPLSTVCFLLAVLLSAAIATGSDTAHAAWAQLENPGPDTEAVGRRPLIRFSLSPDAPGESIYVLLDNVDVTDLLEPAQGGFQFRPGALLPPGDHQLALILVDSAGGQHEQVLLFGSRHHKLYREGSLNGDVSGIWQGALYRSHHLAEPYNQGEGNMGINGRVSEGRWTADIRTNMRYVDLDEPLEEPEEKGVQVADYLLGLSYDTGSTGAEAQLGDVNVLESPLTATGLARRGGTLALRHRMLTLHGFSVSSKSLYGFNGGLGIGNYDDEKVDGWSAEVKLLSDRLSAKVIQVKGSDEEDGFGTYDSRPRRVSEARSAVVTADPLQGRMVLQGEMALSDYDEDDTDDIETETDQAWRVGARGSGDFYNYEFKYERIGPDYAVVGNDYVQGDQAGFSATTGLSRLFHSVELGYSHYIDNIESDPLFAQVGRQDFLINYTFSRFETIPLTLGYEKVLLDSRKEPSAYDYVNQDSDTYSASTSYLQPWWQVGVTASWATVRDKIDERASEDALTLSFMPALLLQHFSLQPVFTWVRNEADETNDVSNTYTFTLDFRGDVPLMRCDYGFTGTLNDVQAELADSDSRSVDLSAEISWRLEHPLWAPLQPAVGLRGRYIKQDYSGYESEEEGTAYLFFQLGLPYAY